MGNSLAPIAFFAYKRADLAGKTLASLKACRLSEQSYLRIYCDGPKTPTEAAMVDEVRKVVRSKNWCGKADIIERTENWGLSKSIRSGVSELCEEFGRAIVVEDDLILHSSFLEFMNEGLSRYAEDSRVMQVSGYNYPVQIENHDDAFFLCHASCWGWGTWKRAWDKFDSSSVLLEQMKSDPELRKEFDMDDSYPYFEMLRKQVAGELDSWGVYWYQTLFKNKGLVLMPNKTLVCNRGTDGLGTHVGAEGYPDVMSDTEVKKFPTISSSQEAHQRIASYLASRQRRSLFSRRPFSWIKMLTGVVSS